MADTESLAWILDNYRGEAMSAQQWEDLPAAKGRIEELEAQVVQSAMAMTFANLDARNEYRLAETWRAHAKVEDDLRGWLRVCSDDPAGHAEFYAWASHLYFGTPPPEETP